MAGTVVLTGYLLSFGPIHWLGSRGYVSAPVLNMCQIIYWPTTVLVQNGPEPVSKAIWWYACLWHAKPPLPTFQ